MCCKSKEYIRTIGKGAGLTEQVPKVSRGTLPLGIPQAH